MNKVICDGSGPIVQTEQGKICGYYFQGVNRFFGVPYGKAGRFEEPGKPEPWEGVRDTVVYGHICMQIQPDRIDGDITAQHCYWPQSEDCLNLNIWTPEIGDDQKKPVIVWLHGGGFFSGSAIEQACYEGGNLAKYGDAVVVSVNHRLNVLGYLDLSCLGEEFRYSSTYGHMDIVAALQWIHDNIRAFGGDPDNVTVFGQSGGGGKICALLQIPAADGLFHKALIMSGILENDGAVEFDREELVERILEKLHIPRKDAARQIRQADYHALAAAYAEAYTEVTGQKNVFAGFFPDANGFYCGDAMKYGFREHARTIPVMIGSCFEEFPFHPVGMNSKIVTMEEQREQIAEMYGQEHVEELTGRMREAYPRKQPGTVVYLDAKMFRYATKAWIKKRAESGAPVYSYLFAPEFAFNGGRQAWHCSDIPFWFHNVNDIPAANSIDDPDGMEEALAGALVSFARTGDPNHAAIPKWMESTADTEETMIFDTVHEVIFNHDDALLEAVRKYSKSTNDWQDVFSEEEKR